MVLKLLHPSIQCGEYQHHMKRPFIHWMQEMWRSVLCVVPFKKKKAWNIWHVDSKVLSQISVFHTVIYGEQTQPHLVTSPAKWNESMCLFVVQVLYYDREVDESGMLVKESVPRQDNRVSIVIQLCGPSRCSEIVGVEF